MIYSTPFKVLCFFINFGNNQTHFLNKILNELDTIENFNFTKIIFSTHYSTFNQKNIINYILPENIGKELTRQPYIFIEQNKDILDNYDYILYNENDNFISKNAFLEFIKWNNLLEQYNLCTGFIRYEINNDGFKYIVDPVNHIEKEDCVQINNINFFTLKNVHSGCWIFTNKQFKKFILNNINLIGYTLEDRASNVYKSNTFPGSPWGIQKFFPVESFQELLIHHMPDKYTHINDSIHGKIKIDNFLKK